jgi:hypothetical protein
VFNETTWDRIRGDATNGMLVNLGANNDVTVTGTVAVTDNSGSLTVDAPVGTPVFVRLSDGASAISTLPVSLASVPSHAVTNAGTFVVQENGAALTSLQLIDDVVVADNAGFTDGTTKLGMAGFIYDEVAGTALTENDAAAARINANRAVVNAIEDGSTRGRYATVTASNALKVDGSGVTQPISASSLPLPTGASTLAEQQTQTTSLQLIDDGIATVASAITTKGMAAVGTDGTNARILKTDTSGELQVDIVGALPAGTNAIGKLAANSGVDIGDVDVTSAVITGGAVAHDGIDSGNPIKVGARAAATLSDDTMVANADRTDNVSDLDGALITRPNYPLGDVLSERTSNTDGASTASTTFGATASTRNCITGYHVFRTDAGTTPIYIDFRDGTGGSILWSAVIPPNGGSNSPQYSGPCLFRTTANTALAYDVSAATTTVYINVTGFKSKV